MNGHSLIDFVKKVMDHYKNLMVINNGYEPFILEVRGAYETCSKLLSLLELTCSELDQDLIEVTEIYIEELYVEITQNNKVLSIKKDE